MDLNHVVRVTLVNLIHTCLASASCRVVSFGNKLYFTLLVNL